MLIAPLFVAGVMMGTTIQDVPSDLQTVAEASDYRKTARYDEVIALLDRIQAKSTILRRAELGKTSEGRSIPLVILANPPIATVEQARASGKLIAFAFANIHAGEVCGKEAELMLTRELALNPDHPWFQNTIVVFAPIYNADGNERMGPGNRPGQNGPDEMGQRPNAQGYDLNRDYIKLESPEARALVRFMTVWDPHLTMDLHTTDGSQHQLTLTYDVPLNPSGHPAPIAFARNEMLPAVRDRVREKTGYEMFYYGNFNRDQTVWTTYSPLPRYGGSYQGLRGQLSILSEAYSYAPFKDRVLCTKAFVEEVFNFCHEHAAELMAMHEQVKADTVTAGANPQPDDVVGLRHEPAAFSQPAVIKGWKMEAAEGPGAPGGRRGRGRPRPTDEPQDYPVVHVGHFTPTLSVRRPYAYLIPPGLDTVIEKLKQHGMEMESFSGSVTVEQYTVTGINIAGRPFQGHQNQLLDVESSVKTINLPAGASIVRTDQPLGNLIVYMLEPQSEDGLAAWNFLDDQLEVGKAYPIARVRHPSDLNRR